MVKPPLQGRAIDLGGEVTGHVSKRLFLCGLLCNNASFGRGEKKHNIIGDPTEAALLVSAAKAGISSDAKRLDELPFDSERKLMSVLVNAKEKILIFSKGAPDHILACCSHALVNGEERTLTSELRSKIEKQNSLYAGKAMRVLGFAMGKAELNEPFGEKNLVFLGLQAMIDPPRSDVIESIRRTKAAGIRVIMITGDYAKTAEAVAAEIGIEGKVIGSTELEAMDDDALQKALEDGTNIFARVAPEHKLRIVNFLQRAGFTVAMTGDGVNDAPALKKANIGVAVGSGTDVAKEAADFVLLDDSFTPYRQRHRRRTRQFTTTSRNRSCFFFRAISVRFSDYIPGGRFWDESALRRRFSSSGSTWFTDGAPALAYSVDPYGRDIMLRPPKSGDEGILPGKKLKFLLVLGVLGTAIALFLFNFSGGNSTSVSELTRAQTLVFNFVVLYEIILTFVIRFDYQVAFLPTNGFGVLLAWLSVCRHCSCTRLCPLLLKSCH